MRSDSVDFQFGLGPLFDRLFDGVLLFAPEPWRVIYANSAASSWLNASVSDLMGKGFEALLDAGVRKAALAHIEGARQSNGAIAAQIDFKVGGTVEARFCRVVFAGEPLVGVIFRTASLRRDPVTGLLDRDFLMARLAVLLLKGPSVNSRFAVLFIDLNNFKDVNDQHGHLIGDSVLREAARRIEGCLRKGNHVVRFGGDEFVVLLERLATADDVDSTIGLIETAVSKPIAMPDGEVTLSLSVGVAMGPGQYRTPEEILVAADRAMYAAKRGV